MKLLIVVDFQQDFVDGALGFEKARLLDDRIAEKITAYRKRGDAVLFTKDTHEENYPDTQEGKHLPVIHCVKGTPGWELYGKVKELAEEDDLVIEKPAFGSAELFDHMRTSCDQYTAVELVGLVSNICVLSNAILVKTACPELPVQVDTACTACADPDDHAAALRMLQSVQVELI